MTTNIKYDFLGVKLDGDVVLQSSGFHGECDSDAQAEHQARRLYEDHDFDRVIITRTGLHAVTSIPGAWPGNTNRRHEYANLSH